MRLLPGGHHVGKVKSHVFRLRHDLQIGRIVVLLVAINVMNNLALDQGSADHLLGNDSMDVPAVNLSIGL